MTINNSNPSLITNHPPLAHDAQGCKLPVPHGTTHWRIMRFTAGRPKTMPGRFDLDLTPEQLLEMCGPGQYRVEALDEYGKPLAEVAKIVVGVPSDGAAVEAPANQNARPLPPSDTRFLVETIAQMSRSHSESLQSLANAQADWIKTLATSKQLPRNANPVALQLQSASPPTESEEPEPWWVHLLKPSTLLGINGLVRNLGSMLGFKQEAPEPAPRRNASALAQISERVASTKQPEPLPEASKLDPRAIEEAFLRAKARIDVEAAQRPHDETEEKPS
jgi:hypothetical protein